MDEPIIASTADVLSIRWRVGDHDATAALSALGLTPPETPSPAPVGNGWMVRIAHGQCLLVAVGQTLRAAVLEQLAPGTHPSAAAWDVSPAYRIFALPSGRSGAMLAANADAAAARGRISGAVRMAEVPAVVLPTGAGEVRLIVDRALADHVADRLLAVPHIGD